MEILPQIKYMLCIFPQYLSRILGKFHLSPALDLFIVRFKVHVVLSLHSLYRTAFGNSHVQINMEGRRLNHATINSVTPRVRRTNQVLIAWYSRAALEK